MNQANSNSNSSSISSSLNQLKESYSNQISSFDQDVLQKNDKILTLEHRINQLEVHLILFSSIILVFNIL